MISGTEEENWNGIDVYVKSYYTGDKSNIYTYIQEDTLIEITVSAGFEKTEVQQIIEKAVRD